MNPAHVFVQKHMGGIRCKMYGVYCFCSINKSKASKMATKPILPHIISYKKPLPNSAK